jgi:CBS domain containing-hemolysin-like protein
LTQIPLLFAALLLALGLGAFFSASETALFSLSPVQRKRIGESRSHLDRRVAGLLERPTELLATILVGNTGTDVLSAVVATTIFHQLEIAHGVILATIFDTILVVLVAEILPKMIAVNAAVPIARISVDPLYALTKILRPATAAVNALSDFVLARVGAHGRTQMVSGRELRTLFEEVARDRLISPEERKIARNIFGFSETTVDEILTPRVDVAAVSRDTPRADLLGLVAASRHARVPVWEGSVDNIVGFLNAKELLLNPEADLESLLNPVLVVPDSAPASQVFLDLRRRKLNLVVVVNEYGETQGIVTKEDLLEEIVGEIYDEFETEERPIVRIGPGEARVDGRVLLAHLNEELSLDIPDEGARTVNGFLAELAGAVPVRGAVYTHEGVSFEVLEVRKHAVSRCRIRFGEPAAAPAGRAAGAVEEGAGSRSGREAP